MLKRYALLKLGGGANMVMLDTSCPVTKEQAIRYFRQQVKGIDLDDEGYWKNPHHPEITFCVAEYFSS